jgi:sugar O-acyltransferase (sialic acid O-acetyltransferase NeuD family)
MTRLVLLGAGGLAREALEAARAAGDQVVGVLDDDPAKQGHVVGGVPIAGAVTDARSLHPQVQVLAAVASSADPGRRRRVVERADLPPEGWGRVVPPAAALGGSVTGGAGSIVLAQVVATADVTIGRHVAIMPACVLTHDVSLGDGCTLAAGVKLAGGVTVETDAYLGAGALVREGLRIGTGAVVGMGAVVTRSVPAREVWAGVPARRLR